MANHKHDVSKENNTLSQEVQSQPLVWEAPRLHGEAWINTLGGKIGGKENAERPDRSN